MVICLQQGADCLHMVTGLEKLRQVNCIVVKNSSSSVKLVDDTYMTVDESWPFTTSQSTVTL